MFVYVAYGWDKVYCVCSSLACAENIIDEIAKVSYDEACEIDIKKKFLDIPLVDLCLQKYPAKKLIDTYPNQFPQLVDRYEKLGKVFVASHNNYFGRNMDGVFLSKKEAKKCTCSTDIVSIFMNKLNDEFIINKIKIHDAYSYFHEDMDHSSDHPGWENLASYMEKTVEETQAWADEMAENTTHGEWWWKIEIFDLYEPTDYYVKSIQCLK
uniref:Uncharacterized protein n=1 Tax=Marseillevirus LCMAC102 TaxID=2506603 RepID=A0A481YU17_9VIRU|nr:MAG: hypothetical protein LCMAC102_03840 [Marseillevirus LCMAC102]